MVQGGIVPIVAEEFCMGAISDDAPVFHTSIKIEGQACVTVGQLNTFPIEYPRKKERRDM